MSFLSVSRILAILLAVLITTQVGEVMWVSFFYSLAFAHYALALWYAKGKVMSVASQPYSWAPAIGVMVIGLGFYHYAYSLLIYFGVHHVFNEVYLAKRHLRLPEDARGHRFLLSAVVVNSLIYAVALRHYREIAWIDPHLLFVCLAFAYGFFCASLYQILPQLNRRSLFDGCVFELMGALLVVVSLFTPISLLQIVLYHFLLWAINPLAGFVKRGKQALLTYVVLSIVLIGGFLSLSAVGMGDDRFMKYYEWQFIFWSYIHITASFILSDAQPAWITSWFQPRKSSLQDCRYRPSDT
ncbi:MAG: hypothetical protein WC736_16055 [Gallionella sp.]|jgi:hypothetical protein